MVPIEWAEPAFADLQQIYDYIARDSPRYAELTVLRIQESVERLARFPELGHVPLELPTSDYRQIVVGSYRVIHRAEENRVLILGVIHASRNLPPILEDRA